MDNMNFEWCDGTTTTPTPPDTTDDQSCMCTMGCTYELKADFEDNNMPFSTEYPGDMNNPMNPDEMV